MASHLILPVLHGSISVAHLRLQPQFCKLKAIFHEINFTLNFISEVRSYTDLDLSNFGLNYQDNTGVFSPNTIKMFAEMRNGNDLGEPNS